MRDKTFDKPIMRDKSFDKPIMSDKSFDKPIMRDKSFDKPIMSDKSFDKLIIIIIEIYFKPERGLHTNIIWWNIIMWCISSPEVDC